MKFAHYALIAIFGLVSFAAAQPRPVDKTPASQNVKTAPAKVPAKYEGGVFGFDKKEEGSLMFDDESARLVFLGQDGKEKFGIPYEALQIISPSEKSVTSTAGSVIQHAPLPGAGLAGMIKEKKRYLMVQFDDADLEAKGTTSFKLDGKDLLASVLHTLGQKANMRQRGEAYIGRRW